MTNNIKSEYDEISPITGNLCVLVEEDQGVISRLCMESGFHTNDMLIKDSEIQNVIHSSFAEIMRNLAFYEIRGDKTYVWYPVILNTGVAFLFVAGTSQKYQWHVADIVYHGEIPYIEVDKAAIFDQFEDAFQYLTEKTNIAQNA